MGTHRVEKIGEEMKITEKMLKAYLSVAESMNQDKDMATCARFFHRTKKCAFCVEARRLDKDGWLPGEREALVTENGKRPL